ncbi:hypothetical protein BH11MYX3_BH11MYX3_49550 [soil metagenome]
MIESFVDLTYRGLSLGRRVKLSQVRPSTGYLETPAPMPVGTAIQIATDEGVTLDATVTGVHEQTGGSDKAPGMTVAPKLAGEASESWWRARVAYPDETAATPAVSRTTSRVTVHPRTHTAQEPVAAPIAQAPIADIAVADSKQTMIMPAVDQELLEQLTRTSGEGEAPIEQSVGASGEYEVVDDGKKTMMMEVIDPAALGLDMSSSGSFPVVDEDSGVVSGNGDDKKSGGNGSKKRRKKR